MKGNQIERQIVFFPSPKLMRIFIKDWKNTYIYYVNKATKCHKIWHFIHCQDPVIKKRPPEMFISESIVFGVHYVWGRMGDSFYVQAICVYIFIF